MILQEDQGGFFNDNVSVTGDPTRAGYAYVTWIRGELTAPSVLGIASSHSLDHVGQPMFSRTTNGGQTWSHPSVIRNGPGFQGPEIVVLPDGTLLTVAAMALPGGIQHNGGLWLAALRSRDAGVTWSGPFQIASLGTAALFNPDDNTPVRGRDYQPDVAVDPATGTVFVAWADAQGGTTNRIVMSMSTNGGRTWSAPQVVSTGGPTVQAFNHAVTVTPDGTLAFMYYDFRNNVVGDGVLTTDVWMRHSHDAGATWGVEMHLGGPFAMNLAPISAGRGPFLGDRQTLAAIIDDELLAFFTTTLSDGATINSVRAHHP